ncbi:MAG: nitroreductase family protein [Thermoplasmata archaeon]
MDLFEAMKTRRSIRKYKSQMVDEEVIRKIFQIVRHAPSAHNAQPWKFVVVRDEEKKRKIAQYCNNQKFISEAPVVIVACGLPDESQANIGNWISAFVVDVSIATTYLMLAAWSLGLGTCWIGNFNEEKVKEVLGLGNDVRIVAITPLGYPDENPEPQGRKNLSEIVVFEGFG